MTPEILKTTLIIGCGSFLGGAARYLISVAMKTVNKGFPWGTLLVNLLGCFLIGLLWGFFSRTSNANSIWSPFLTIGLCGGFASYIAISVIAGIALVALGYILLK